jgi:hypothetical protein
MGSEFGSIHHNIAIGCLHLDFFRFFHQIRHVIPTEYPNFHQRNQGQEMFICLKLYGKKYFDGCNYYYKPLKLYKVVQIIVLIVLFLSGYHSWRNYVST